MTKKRIKVSIYFFVTVPKRGICNRKEFKCYVNITILKEMQKHSIFLVIFFELISLR